MLPSMAATKPNRTHTSTVLQTWQARVLPLHEHAVSLAHDIVKANGPLTALLDTRGAVERALVCAYALLGLLAARWVLWFVVNVMYA